MKTAHKFGYAIDYDKAIAEDRSDVDFFSSDIVRALSADMTEQERVKIDKSGGQVRLYDYLFENLERIVYRGSLVGFTKDELRALAIVTDWAASDESVFGAEQPGDRRLGYILWEDDKRLSDKTLAGWVFTEEKRRECLKKSKADLSRHIRNKAKFDA